MKMTRKIDGVTVTIEIDEFDREAEKAAKAINDINSIKPYQKKKATRRIPQHYAFTENNISRLFQV